MNPFEMVVIIVALGILGGVIKHYLDNRMDTQDNFTRSQRELITTRLDRVEERLKNLERIVTSEEYDLKRRFQELEEER